MCKFSGDKPVSIMKVTAGMLCASNRLINWEMFESERVCSDPKDGELCLRRAKSGETLMEARSGTDVICGYRGERLIEPSSPPKFPSG